MLVPLSLLAPTKGAVGKKKKKKRESLYYYEPLRSTYLGELELLMETNIQYITFHSFFY